MLDGIGLTLTAALAAGAAGALRGSLRLGGPGAGCAVGGTAAPDRTSALIVALAGVGLLAGGVLAVVHGPASGSGLAALVAVVGLAGAGLTAPSLRAGYAVHWTERSIQGPARTFGPSLGGARTEIVWPELSWIGRAETGYWFVEAHDGRRVLWSDLYDDHAALTSALRSHRPDLDLPVR